MRLFWLIAVPVVFLGGCGFLLFMALSNANFI